MRKGVRLMIMAREFYLKSGRATMVKLSPGPAILTDLRARTKLRGGETDRLFAEFWNPLRKKGKHWRASPNGHLRTRSSRSLTDTVLTADSNEMSPEWDSLIRSSQRRSRSKSS